MKIAIVSNIPSPYRVDLFHYLQSEITEYEWAIIYTNKSESNREWSIERDKLGNSIILRSRVIKIKGKIDNRYIHIPPSMKKVLDEVRPDIVIAFEYNPAALQSLFWCKKKRIPFIHWTDGTLNSEKSIGMIQRASRGIITKNAAACIASSTKAKEKLLSYGVKESSIFISLLTANNALYNRNKRHPIKGRILYVGSMVDRKGVDLLIKAISCIRSDYEVHIVGNGTEQQLNKLKAMAEALGVSDKIKWCGYKEGEALAKEYMEASVFVLPTREDCFGLVLLEALFAGVPIVSSKYADGAYDIIQPNVNGVLVDPFNALEFARGIESVMKEKRYIENASKMDVSKFSYRNVGGYCKCNTLCKRVRGNCCRFKNVNNQYAHSLYRILYRRDKISVLREMEMRCA